MSDTFDSDVDSLPTVTKALRQAWINVPPNPFGNPANLDAVAAPFSMRAVLDAIHALELRIVALES